MAAGTLATGALAACSSSSSAGSSAAGGGSNGSTYTIHAILSVTGRNSFLGVDEKASLMELQKVVNSTGGIQGHPVSFDIADNQSTAATSVSLASPLLSQVPVLIVGSATATDRPVDELETGSGPVIYDLSPGDHPAVGSSVYSASNSTTNQTLAFINFAKAKGWSHVAAITSTDSSGQDGWDNISKAAAGTDGAVSIVNHQTFDPTAVSVTTQLAKIKAANPQAVFIWTTGTPLTTVLSGMQQLGMSAIPVMTSNGNESFKQMQGLGSALPGQLYFPSSQFRLSPGHPDRAGQDGGGPVQRQHEGRRAGGAGRGQRAGLGPGAAHHQRAAQVRRRRHRAADPAVHLRPDRLPGHRRDLRLRQQGAGGQPRPDDQVGLRHRVEQGEAGLGAGVRSVRRRARPHSGAGDEQARSDRREATDRCRQPETS